jgi:isoleucyl-tRNA synthetase
MLAPILPFTTEEVWQNAPILRTSQSAHLSDWPDKQTDIEKWIDADLDKKWETLIAIREAILVVLEEKRMKKVLGSPLEAKVKIYAKNRNLRKLLNCNIKHLPMLFIVSQVELEDTMPEEARDFGELAISVRVQSADGKKCQRCWNYSTSVGAHKEHPNICKKCLDNIY